MGMLAGLCRKGLVSKLHPVSPAWANMKYPLALANRIMPAICDIYIPAGRQVPHWPWPVKLVRPHSEIGLAAFATGL